MSRRNAIPKAKRLSECSAWEMTALTGTSGVLCDKCGSTEHNTAGHKLAGGGAK